jgi:hypothetical protein
LSEDQIEKAIQALFVSIIKKEADSYEKRIEASQKIDLHSKESRISLTKMVIHLFCQWQIPLVDQAALLNRSSSTICRYHNGACFADDNDMHARVTNLLCIHKNLRILFPHNRDLVYRWVSAKNQAFDGKAPIELMKKELNGIIAVGNYLESSLQL